VLKLNYGNVHLQKFFEPYNPRHCFKDRVNGSEEREMEGRRVGRCTRGWGRNMGIAHPLLSADSCSEKHSLK